MLKEYILEIWLAESNSIWKTKSKLEYEFDLRIRIWISSRIHFYWIGIISKSDLEIEIWNQKLIRSKNLIRLQYWISTESNFKRFRIGLSEFVFTHLYLTAKGSRLNSLWGPLNIFLSTEWSHEHPSLEPPWRWLYNFCQVDCYTHNNLDLGLI